MTKETITLKISNCMLAFRPNNKVHDSGYNCFDIAYFDLDTKQYHIVSNYLTDVINLNENFLDKNIRLSMETKQGWIRIWTKSPGNLKWEDPLSDVEISLLEDPNETITIEKY